MKPGTIAPHSLLVIGLVISILSYATRAFQSPKPVDNASKENVRTSVPAGLPESLWRNRIPSDNALTPEKIALGQSMYFDKRLSIDGTVSCATCHDPAMAFTDSNSVGIGTGAKRGTRNSPTILNSMFSENLFWDGRAHSLEEQVIFPLMSSFEMGMTTEEKLINRVSSVPEYRRVQASIRIGRHRYQNNSEGNRRVRTHLALR